MVVTEEKPTMSTGAIRKVGEDEVEMRRKITSPSMQIG